jgi:hypothetical protein
LYIPLSHDLDYHLAMITANEISSLVQKTIVEWHQKQAKRNPDYVIVSDDIRKIRQLNCHRNDILEVITDLVNTNCEIWHEEDKVRSNDDQKVLKAIRNINPLNQHRNDVIEEVDEIFRDSATKAEK